MLSQCNVSHYRAAATRRGIFSICGEFPTHNQHNLNVLLANYTFLINS